MRYCYYLYYVFSKALYWRYCEVDQGIEYGGEKFPSGYKKRALYFKPVADTPLDKMAIANGLTELILKA
jgi:hypothetical protein